SNLLLTFLFQAFRLSELEETGWSSNWYVPTSVFICAGAFIFFVMEFALRSMRLFLEVTNYLPFVLYCEL
ncbi:uncharacterized protein DEA37_0013867, partial [Paragonimus westermani]